jgi:glycosyltransferase involved in cell wall biosynthesis
MSTPSVSVIIPSYNTATFITETLDSVFAQTFKDYEVIVVNDGSPDTPRLEIVLEPYLSRIVYLKQENQGPAGARNTGIRHAQGIFLAFLDSDDMWLPNFLAEQMKIFRSDPSLDLVYADTFFFRESPLIGTFVTRRSSLKGAVTFENILTVKCQVQTSCTVVRKAAVMDAGLFDERFCGAEDYDLWVRIAKHGGRMMRQNKVLGLYRVHSASLSANSERMIEEWLRVLRNFHQVLELTPKTQRLLDTTVRRAQAHLELAKGNRYLSSGQTDLARSSFERAQEFFQTRKLSLVGIGLKVAPRLVGPFVEIWRLFLEGVNYLVSAKQGRIYWTWKRRELYQISFRGGE